MGEGGRGLPSREDWEPVRDGDSLEEQRGMGAKALPDGDALGPVAEANPQIRDVDAHNPLVSL